MATTTEHELPTSPSFRTLETTDLAKARACARELLRDCGIVAREDIRIDRFTSKLGVQVVYGQLDGADAALVRNGDRGTIIVSDRPNDRGAIRFAIAHELGHFALNHPSPTIFELVATNRTGRPYRSFAHETEANAFASELLMPAEQLLPVCQRAAVDLEVPRQIVREYDVSIVASAIRFAELTAEPCAVVFCEDGRVKWVARSAAFHDNIRRGRPLNVTSIACRFFIDGELEEGVQRVPPTAWLDVPGGRDLVEHSICSRKYGTVLSMIGIAEVA